MFNNICLSKCPHIIVLIIKLMQIRGAILMTYVTKRSRLAKYGVNLQEWNDGLLSGNHCKIIQNIVFLFTAN